MATGSSNTLALVALPPGIGALRVGGIAAPLRLARQFRRWSSGVRVVFVCSDDSNPAERAMADRAGAELRSVDELRKASAAIRTGGVLFAAGDLVLSGEGWEEAAESGPFDVGACAVVDGVTTLDLGRAPGVDETLLAWLEGVVAGHERTAAYESTFAVAEQRVLGKLGPASEARLDEAIAAALDRPQDPNFPRLTKRRFSKLISRPLARRDVSPHWVTSAAIAVGWCAAWLIYSGDYVSTLIGACCLVFSRILDDCDGEVARLTQRQSKVGEIYDITADILVYAAVFLALTATLHREYPDGRFLLAFGVLFLGALVTTVLILRYVKDTDLPKRSALARSMETTASGDFAYLYFFVSLFGLEELFLYLSAVGSHAFWVALAVIIRNDRVSRG